MILFCTMSVNTVVYTVLESKLGNQKEFLRFLSDDIDLNPRKTSLPKDPVLLRDLPLTKPTVSPGENFGTDLTKA